MTEGKTYAHYIKKGCHDKQMTTGLKSWIVRSSFKLLLQVYKYAASVWSYQQQQKTLHRGPNISSVPFNVFSLLSFGKLLKHPKSYPQRGDELYLAFPFNQSSLAQQR